METTRWGATLSPKDELFVCPAAGRMYPAGEAAVRMRLIDERFVRRLSMAEAASYFARRRDVFAAGELWGKVMRAATLICAEIGDGARRAELLATADEMLALQDADGDISTSPKDLQPNGTHGSDLWERKYVLLGLLGVYDLTGEPRVLDGARRLALYTAGQVGRPPKHPITRTGWAFFGIESSSILEPVMRVYRLTGEAALLDFGRYIVESGACGREDVFAAIVAGKSPALVGDNGNPAESVAKAYEMTSCFEGLLEYYLATGEENALAAAEVYAEALAREEITPLGSGGCNGYGNRGPGDGEQWNFGRSEVAHPAITHTMETCVTVTYLKFLLRLFRTTGKAVYLDRAEVTIRNALFASMKERGEGFDYFISFAGRRGCPDNFGYPLGEIFVSCCSANGPMGLAQIPCHAVLRGKDGYFVTLLGEGVFDFGDAIVSVCGDVVLDGAARVRVRPQNGEAATVQLRVPAYLRRATIACGQKEKEAAPGEVLTLSCPPAGAEWVLSGEIEPRIVDTPESRQGLPPSCVLTYGPLVMAADTLYGGEVGADAALPPLDGRTVERRNGTLRLYAGGRVFIPYAEAGRGGEGISSYRALWAASSAQAKKR